MFSVQQLTSTGTQSTACSLCGLARVGQLCSVSRKAPEACLHVIQCAVTRNRVKPSALQLHLFFPLFFFLWGNSISQLLLWLVFI